MYEKTCCVTGHREIPINQIAYVREELQKQIHVAIQDGYTRFISGFAKGVDLLFAAIVVEEKKQYPNLMLEAALPYAGRLKTNDQNFHMLLKNCNSIKIECEKYTPSCFMQRNRYMVSKSQRVIAVYDGRESGGTLFTMRYAHVLEREIYVIEI